MFTPRGQQPYLSSSTCAHLSDCYITVWIGTPAPRRRCFFSGCNSRLSSRFQHRKIFFSSPERSNAARWKNKKEKRARSGPIKSSPSTLLIVSDILLTAGILAFSEQQRQDQNRNGCHLINSGGSLNLPCFSQRLSNGAFIMCSLQS